jgi:hypothetical protein
VWTAVLMSWNETPTLTERFALVREQLHALCPRWRLGSSYSGWCDALRDCSDKVLPAIVLRLRERVKSLPPKCQRREGWIALAGDGSRVECPRTEANEQGLGCAGKERTTPQLMVTTLYHMGTGLPWAFEVGPGTESERCQLQRLIPTLPENALLVTDAGFASYELCDALPKSGRHFLLRVGGNIHLLTDLGYDYEVDGQTVYLWPQNARQHGQPPLRLRLIVLGSGENRVYLITDILDPAILSDAQAGRLYAMRWGIEVFYRSYKRTMTHHKMLSRTPATCVEEFRWTMIGLWLMGVLSVEKIVAAGHDPLAWSVAKSRNSVRRALRGALSGRSAKSKRMALCRQLASAVKDAYVRRGPKRARDWPHKKREHPPGPPKIRPATAEEVQQAQQLTTTKLAA